MRRLLEDLRENTNLSSTIFSFYIYLLYYWCVTYLPDWITQSNSSLCSNTGCERISAYCYLLAPLQTGTYTDGLSLGQTLPCKRVEYGQILLYYILCHFILGPSYNRMKILSEQFYLLVVRCVRMSVCVLSGHAIFRLEECDRCRESPGLNQNSAQVCSNVIKR